MKKEIYVFYLFVVLFFSIKSQAQEIPNGDFEEWLTCLCDPPHWVTSNIYPPPLECREVFMDFTPYSGNYCVEGIVDTCPELALLRPPLIQSFDIPLNSRPEALHGFYKFIPVGNDNFNGNIKLYKNNILIGEGSFISNEYVSSFTEFILDIEYSSNDTPNVAVIKFTIDSSLVDNKLHQGSKWYIDYLVFGALSDMNDIVNAPSNFILYPNFPNPFNPNTTILFALPQQNNVSLKIYNVLGELVVELINDQLYEEGYHEVLFDGSLLSSGVYFYKIQVGEFLQINKMLLLK